MTTSTRETRDSLAPGCHSLPHAPLASPFLPGATTHGNSPSMGPHPPILVFSRGHETCTGHGNGQCECGSLLVVTRDASLACPACGLVASEADEKWTQYSRGPEAYKLGSDISTAPLNQTRARAMIFIHGHHVKATLGKRVFSPGDEATFHHACSLLRVPTPARFRALHERARMQHHRGYTIQTQHLAALALRVAIMDYKLDISDAMLCDVITSVIGGINTRVYRRVVRRAFTSGLLPSRYAIRLPDVAHVNALECIIPATSNLHDVMSRARAMFLASTRKLAGSSPRGLAAACMYLALDKTVGQQAIADAARVTLVTLRNNMKRMNQLGLIK